VVNARDRSVQERVLQLFPGAFLTYDDDQAVVMQVGAFNERDNAEDVETVLDQNGIRARVERVD
jgi:cell division septation protein DedD